MTDVTEEDIEEVLSEEGRMKLVEITSELHEGNDRCSECGRMTKSYIDLKDEVSEVLRGMILDNRVSSGPRWEYSLVNRR